MISPDESTIEFKKYLKKLKQVIENEAKFSLIDNKIYNKKRLDDVICCLEASWPEDFKKYLSNYDPKKVKSQLYFQKLILSVKNRFLFSSSCYLVLYKDALNAISLLYKSIDSDMRFIYSDQSGMF